MEAIHQNHGSDAQLGYDGIHDPDDHLEHELLRRHWLLTQGGPNGSTYVISVLAYFKAFYQMKLGYASAQSSINMIIMLIFSVFYIKRFQTDV